jgi:hypothetical protein
MERPPLESFFKNPPQTEEEKEIEVEYKFLRGKKGERGEKGDKGKDAESEEVAEMVIIPVSEILKDDEDFKKSVRGLDGINGKDGKDGTSPELDIAEITERVLNILPSQTPKVLKGEDGKNGSPDTPKEIIEKINKSRGEKIKRSRIEGLDDVENKAASTEKRLQNYISLGGNRQTRVSSNGTLISSAAETINFIGPTVAVPVGNNGTTVNVTTTSSGFAGTQEKSTTTPNGSQQTFAFTHTPTLIFWNGLLQTLTDDYTVSSNNITFTGTLTPQTGDKIINIYA